MVRHAIKNDDTIDFNNIDKKYLTEDVYYLLLKYNRIILAHVPEEMRTPIMCMLAVYIDDYNYEFIPLDVLNDEKCKTVIMSLCEEI